MEKVEVALEDIHKTIQELFLENEAGITDLFELHKRVEEAYIGSIHRGTAWVQDNSQVVVPAL